MAKDDKAQAPEQGGGSKKKLIFIVVGALALVGISVGATVAVLGILAPSPAVDEAVVEEVPKGEPRYVELEPAFTVNLADGSNILRITIALLVYGDTIEGLVKEHMPRIRNSLVLLFSGLSAGDIAERSGRDALRANALESVRGILSEYAEAPDMEVFFTGFVMQ